MDEVTDNQAEAWGDIIESRRALSIRVELSNSFINWQTSILFNKNV